MGLAASDRRTRLRAPWSLLVLAAAAFLALSPRPSAAQNDSVPPADQPTGTYAIRGLTIGAITGGIVGGVGFGLLASALCESDDCQEFDAAVIGALGGAAVAGLTGLVIGSFIPRGPREQAGRAAPEPDAADVPHQTTPTGSPFRIGLSVGPGTGQGEVYDQMDVTVALTLMADRPPPTNVGLEFTYLGYRTQSYTRQVFLGSGGIATTTNTRRLWGGSLLATRLITGTPSGGGFLAGSVGAYLEQFSIVTTGTSSLSGSRKGSDFFPGVSIGGGGAFTTWDRVGLGFDARSHLVFGAGDGFAALFSLGGTLWFLR